MKCKSYSFTGHAMIRMAQRDVSVDDIKNIVETGEVIKDYPNDTLYPSRIILGKASGKYLHVEASSDSKQNCYIITVYIPTLDIWNEDLKTKKK